MARASYIWVVMAGNGAPLAAFTVRHELETWLTQRAISSRWTVQRFRHRDQHSETFRAIDFVYEVK